MNRQTYRDTPCDDKTVFRVIIDTDVEEFMNDYFLDLGSDFRFVSYGDGTSFITATLPALLQLVVDISPHSTQQYPVSIQQNVLSYRGVIVPC